MKPLLLSLVVPVYFEEDCIGAFIGEVRTVLDALALQYEIVFVDDGSTDRTCELIRAQAADDARIKLVEFSYNQGKQAAVTAGIRYANGDLLLYMDPDLQDPPYEIPRFLAEMDKGYDLVFGVRNEKKDSRTNKLLSSAFWAILNRFTGLRIPPGLAVMRMFNRRFADRFLEYGEKNRFIEGIFMLVGLRRTSIVIDQRERFAGTSKFNFRRKVNLALDAILDFSELPLKLAMRIGLLLSLVGFAAIALIVVLKLTLVSFQAGWASVLSLLLTGFGVQLVFMGIIGMYIGRIYKESKGRPLYSIRAFTNLAIDADDRPLRQRGRD